MALSLSGVWVPPAGERIEEGCARMARLLDGPEWSAFLGCAWYRPGGSKRAALAKPVALELIASGGAWKRSDFGAGEAELRLSLWNGRDGDEDAALMVTLQEGVPLALQTFSLSMALEHGRASWDAVVALARAAAELLGGQCAISSNELLEWARRSGLRHANRAAYAVFWGRDTSGRNPAFAGLPKAQTRGPHALLAVDGAEGLVSLQPARVQALVDALPER